MDKLAELLAQYGANPNAPVGAMSLPGSYAPPAPVINTAVTARPSFSDAGFDAANGITPGWTGSDSASGGSFDFMGALKNLFGGATGTKEAPGWGNLALGAGSAILNGYMGMKQYGLAKESLNQSKEQFRLNYEAQKGLTNSQLADRQAARLAADPNSGASVADYMAKYGVK